MKQKAIPILSAVAIASMMLALTVNPRIAMRAFSDGLNVWAQNVLPATLPYLVLCSAFVATGAVSAVGCFLSPVTRALYRTSGMSGYAFLMGAIGGYPVGARVLGDLYASGAIDRGEARRAAAYCATGGPTFVLGTVASLLGATKPAVVILIAHILGAICNGLLYRALKPFAKQHKTTPLPAAPSRDAVWHGVQSMLTVGALIAMFSVVIALAEQVGLLRPVNHVANILTHACGLPDGFGAACIKGLIELTAGCKALCAYSTLAPRAVTVALTALTSFGGACIGMQCLQALRPCGVTTALYLLQKSTQAVLSSLLCLPLCIAFGI